MGYEFLNINIGWSVGWLFVVGWDIDNGIVNGWFVLSIGGGFINGLNIVGGCGVINVLNGGGGGINNGGGIDGVFIVSSNIKYKYT